MKLQALDLNLLVVFEAIYRTGSVTRAAAEVGLTQSSLSNALVRLRAYFNDPLFVRMKGTMLPTPLSQGLARPVQEALNGLRGAIQDKRQFHAMQSERCFRVCMSEVAQRLFLPGLLAHFANVGPGLSLITVDMSSQGLQVALAEGEVDLAIGYFADLGDNFFGQLLFEETYVVLVRKAHSFIGARLTLKDYLRASHLSYQPAAASHALFDQRMDREFARRGAKRRVGLQAAHSMGLSSIVEQTDLVLTVPTRLAQSLAKQVPTLRLLALPVNVPSIDIKQYWHARYHQDPANQWLRSQFMTLFKS